ncbi:hypothetical protein CYMTET_35229, partial [Cymbomonas tetramitiformis]
MIHLTFNLRKNEVKFDDEAEVGVELKARSPPRADKEQSGKASEENSVEISQPDSSNQVLLEGKGGEFAWGEEEEGADGDEEDAESFADAAEEQPK